MKNRYPIAYWLRTDSQHWEHVRQIYERLGGFVLTKNQEIYDYLRNKFPELGDDLVFVRNSTAARRFMFRNRIMLVVYTGFQQIFWGYSVQVFHGSSDKNYLLTKDKVLMYDLLLLPGNKHLKKITTAYRLKNTEKLKLVGYPKFDRLVKGELQNEPLFSNSKPVILYAPTWISQNSGSKLNFSKHGESSLPLWGKTLISSLCPRWNLIIKYHSRINPNETEIYRDIDTMITESALKDSVRVVWDSSIAEYMNQADIMISDISAVCYEWMHTGRPIVFANPAPDHYGPSNDPMSNTFAWRAGDVLYKEEDIVPVIEKNLAGDSYSAIRSELLRETFYKPDGHAGDRQVSEILEFYGKIRDRSRVRLIFHTLKVLFRDTVRHFRLLFKRN